MDDLVSLFLLNGFCDFPKILIVFFSASEIQRKKLATVGMCVDKIRNPTFWLFRTNLYNIIYMIM